MPRSSLRAGTLLAVLAAVAVAGALLAARALRAPPPPSRVAIELAAPGRSPEDVERLVTAPLEDALATIPGLQGMESTSAPGSARVDLTLAPASEGAARARIRERLAAVAPRLPGELPAPAVLPAEERVAFRWTLSSPALPLAELSGIQTRAAPGLSAVPGVVALESCGPDREWRITVDPGRARAVGLVAGDVWKALAAPGASWRTAPEQLRGLVVAARAGAEIRLGDVAQVERGAAEGCRARGPLGAIVTGAAWIRAAEAAAAARALEARLRSMQLPAAVALAVLGASPAFEIDLARAPASADCVAGAAAQLLGTGAWALEEERGRARLAVGRGAPAVRARELGGRLAGALAACPGAAYAGIEGGAADRALLRLRVVGTELDVLDRVAGELREALAGVPGARVLPAPGAAEVLALAVDRERAERLGVPAEEVDRALAATAGGILVGEVQEEGGATPVRLRWGAGEAAVPDALSGAMVRGAGGAMLPLGEVAALRLERQRPILHDERRRALEVRVELEPGTEDGVRRRAREAMRTAPLPAGYLVYVLEEPRGPLEALGRRLTGR